MNPSDVHQRHSSMPGSAGDGPKTQKGTPATKDTNTTLPSARPSILSRSRILQLITHGPPNVSPHFPDTAQQCPHPQCKAPSRGRFLVGKTGGLVGYTTWACNILSLGWTDYHPRSRANWPTGGTLADLQGACTVGPAVSTQRATLTRPTSPGGGAVCMYLHTQYAFLPSCRATSLMQSTLARVRF